MAKLAQAGLELVEARDQRGLGLVVGRPDLPGPLEHHMLQEVADSRGACGLQPRADLKAYEAGDRGRGVPLHEVEAHAVGKGVLHNLKAQPGFGGRSGDHNQSGGYEQGPGGAAEHCLHNPFRFSLSLDLARAGGDQVRPL